MKNGKALRWRYVNKFKIRSEQKLSVCMRECDKLSFKYGEFAII